MPAFRNGLEKTVLEVVSPAYRLLREESGQQIVARRGPYQFEIAAAGPHIELGLSWQAMRRPPRLGGGNIDLSFTQDHTVVGLRRSQADEAAANIGRNEGRIAGERVAVAAGSGTDDPHDVAGVAANDVGIA